MEKEFSNKCVADAARAFEEKEEHKRVMMMLDDAHVNCEYCLATEEHYAMMSDCPSSWNEYSYVGPTPRELEYVANRGNVEEVLFMINHFAEFVGVDEKYLPASVQEIIAKRNNKIEVEAMMKHYGFCSAVQMIILKEWSMDDLRWYINFHGFDFSGQEYILKNWEKEDVLSYFSRHKYGHRYFSSEIAPLLERGDHDIIMCYLKKNYVSEEAFKGIWDRGNNEEILFALEQVSLVSLEIQKKIFEKGTLEQKRKFVSRFKWDDMLVNEMFDKLDKDGVEDDLLEYVKHHELSVVCQKRMLASVSTEFFKTYISKYGLWEDVHTVLLLKRSDEEVRLYLEKHHCLSNEAEDIFFLKASFDDKLFYIETRKRPNLHHLTALIKVRPVEYELLSIAFLKHADRFPRKSEISLSSYDRVRDIVSSGRTLSSKEVVTLFLRDEPELFESYLDRHEVDFD